jgi:4,5-dihydroxyphthalate decarboxylase
MKLNIGIGRYDRTQALIDGRIGVAGHEARFESPPLETLFAAAFDSERYDLAEISFSNFVYLAATGRSRFLGLPIFPSRMFRHSAVFVRTDRGIRGPRDLAGRTVGVREFSMTAALVARGVLEDEYGLRAADIDWRCGPADDSDTRPVIRVMPRDTRVALIDEGKNLSDMLMDGELDAVVAYKPPKCFLAGAPHVGRLFPDPAPVEQDYFARSGIFPIMHLVGIRRDLADDAGLCRAVCEAFQQAKNEAIESISAYQALSVSLPWAPAHLRETTRLMGDDFWPYGVRSNAAAIEAVCRYSHAQGLAPRRMAIEELFAAGALDWTPQTDHAYGQQPTRGVAT